MNKLFPNINMTFHRHLPLYEDQDRIPPPTLFAQASGKYQPYNPDLDSFIRYPIEFCGCYAYDQEDHNQTNNFFSELFQSV